MSPVNFSFSIDVHTELNYAGEDLLALPEDSMYPLLLRFHQFSTENVEPFNEILTNNIMLRAQSYDYEWRNPSMVSEDSGEDTQPTLPSFWFPFPPTTALSLGTLPPAEFSRAKAWHELESRRVPASKVSLTDAYLTPTFYHPKFGFRHTVSLDSSHIRRLGTSIKAGTAPSQTKGASRSSELWASVKREPQVRSLQTSSSIQT